MEEIELKVVDAMKNNAEDDAKKEMVEMGTRFELPLSCQEHGW